MSTRVRAPFARRLSVCVWGTALLLLLAVPAAASEKVDRAGLPGQVAGAIGKYASKSRACLDKLVGIIEKGSERSVSQWESQCKLAENQLVELVRVDGVTTAVGGWLTDEVNAWSRMASVGRGICYVNELLVRQIVHLQWCRDQTERETKTVARSVRESVHAVLKSLGSEARDVLNGAEELDALADKLQLGGGEEVRAIIDRASAFDDEVDEVLEMDERIASTQRYIVLLADSMRRRKTRFLKDNDRLLVRLRQDLARLVSAKIDPDGRGVFDSYEKRIEKAALKNLDEYEKELDKWKAANKTFLGNARDFGKAFVNPAVSSAADMVPYGGGAMTFVKLVKMAGSLIEAVDPFLESVQREVARKTGALYKKVLEASGDIREHLKELEAEKDVALLKLKKQRAREASVFGDESKVELRTLTEELEEHRKSLAQLGEEQQAERKKLEGLIEEVEQRLRAEPVALKRRKARFDRKTDAMLEDLAEKYDERIELVQKRIEETIRVGGEIKRMK